MFTLTIIGSVLFSVGLLMLIQNFNIQSSLSENYYRLKDKNIGYLFYIYLVFTSLLLVAPLCEFAGIFGFLSAAGLMFVGAAAAFKDDKTQRRVHEVGALISASGAIATLIKLGTIKYAIYVIPVMLLFALFTKTIKSSYIFWLEMCAFYSLFVGLLVFLA